MTRLKTWLRRLRGAIGIGLFGSVSFMAFGTFVAFLSRLMYGGNPDLSDNLPILAASGFLAGLVAAVAIMLGARKEGSASTGRSFFLGLILGEGLTFAGVWAMQGPPDGATEWLAIALTGFVLGVAIAILGAGALKVAEEAEPELAEPSQLTGPDPLNQAPNRVRERVEVASEPGD